MLGIPGLHYPDLHLHLHMHFPHVHLYVQILPFYKDASHVRLGPTLLQCDLIALN